MWAKYALYDHIDNIAGICAMSHISPYGSIDITMVKWYLSPLHSIV